MKNSNQPKILGNPEKQKGIERLLKQAGKDKFIDAVVKGEKPPEFKPENEPIDILEKALELSKDDISSYDTNQPMIGYYPDDVFTSDKKGILVCYLGNATFPLIKNEFIFFNTLEKTDPDKHACVYPIPPKVCKLVPKETHACNGLISAFVVTHLMPKFSIVHVETEKSHAYIGFLTLTPKDDGVISDFKLSCFRENIEDGHEYNLPFEITDKIISITEMVPEPMHPELAGRSFKELPYFKI